MDMERRTLQLVARHAGVFMFLDSLLNTLDRANVSFAALQMNAELGFDPKIYGLGAGLFFVGHLLFMLPSVTLLRRWGTRRPLAFMMITWGLIASTMGLIHSPSQFYTLRFLLGVAESGAAPACIYYISQWVPQRAAGGFMARVTLATPIAVILGAPLSGWLMTAFHGFLGLSGWRMMFLIEGLPAVLLGLAVLRWLTDSPADARWLSDPQRQWLLTTLRQDQAAAAQEAVERAPLTMVIANAQIWRCALSLFCLGLGIFGLMYWLPQVVAALASRANLLEVTVLSAIPWLGVALGMVANGWHSDRQQERVLHFACAVLLAAIGLTASVMATSTWTSLAALTMAGIGLGGAQTVYWALPLRILRSKSLAATGFAFINLFPSAAGMAGNVAIGWLRAETGSYAAPIAMLAAVLVLSGVLVLPLRSGRAAAKRTFAG
jgi:ACS family tartrate transporter-like MFS transporter